MDEKEIIETTETIAEVADEIAENSKGLPYGKAVGVGLIACIGGGIAFKYVIKPVIGKIKAKIELRKQEKSAQDEDEESNVIDASFGE